MLRKADCCWLSCLCSFLLLPLASVSFAEEQELESPFFLAPSDAVGPFEDVTWTRGDALSLFAAFENFQSAVLPNAPALPPQGPLGPNNTPDPILPEGGEASVTNVAGGGFITSTENLYTSGTIGNFDVRTTNFGLGEGYTTRVVVQAGSLGNIAALDTFELTYLSNPEADFTDDGAIDDDDFSLFEDEFGADGSSSADGNGDGVVDALDYLTFRDSQTVVVDPIQTGVISEIELQGQFGGTGQEFFAVFDIEDFSPEELTVSFVGGPFFSLNTVIIDAFNFPTPVAAVSAAAIPEPTTFVMGVSLGLLAIFSRRSKVRYDRTDAAAQPSTEA